MPWTRFFRCVAVTSGSVGVACGDSNSPKGVRNCMIFPDLFRKLMFSYSPPSQVWVRWESLPTYFFCPDLYREPVFDQHFCREFGPNSLQKFSRNYMKWPELHRNLMFQTSIKWRRALGHMNKNTWLTEISWKYRNASNSCLPIPHIITKGWGVGIQYTK